MGKNNPRRQEPALPPAKTVADCDKLLAGALKLLEEEPPEFLPAKQKAEMMTKNLDKAARSCRHAIASSVEGFDVAAAHQMLGRVLEKAGDAKGAAESFAAAGGSGGSASDAAAPAADAAPTEPVELEAS